MVFDTLLNPICGVRLVSQEPVETEAERAERIHREKQQHCAWLKVKATRYRKTAVTHDFRGPNRSNREIAAS